MRRAETGHLLFRRRTAIEGTESCEDFLQLVRASPMQTALQRIAAKREMLLMGCETIRTAGMKMRARTSNAAVAV